MLELLYYILLDMKGLTTMYTVGQIAKQVGVTPKTLRHYEKIGLFSPTARSVSGYRLYSDEDVNRLREILYYRELAFPLREISRFISSSEEEKQHLLEAHLCRLHKNVEKYGFLHNKLLQLRQVNPSVGRTAVLVIDMQNDFVSGRLACNRARRVVEPIRTLLTRTRLAGCDILYICDCHENGDSELEFWAEHAMAGSDGAEIIPELCPEGNDSIFQKSSFNAFSNESLNLFLRRRGIQRLIVTGLHTTICVTETVMCAYYLGYDIIVPRECVESPSESEQQVGLKQLQKNYNAAILSLELVLSHLNKETT